MSLETVRQVSGIGITEAMRNFRDGQISVKEHPTGLLDSTPLIVFHRASPRRMMEETSQVRRRDTQLLGQFRDVQVGAFRDVFFNSVQDLLHTSVAIRQEGVPAFHEGVTENNHQLLETGLQICL